MPSETVVKRLTLSRYLFHLAMDHAAMNRGVAAFTCVTVLQDALEIFLLAAAEEVSARISPRTEFAQYLDLINEKLTPDELPFRHRLIEINRIRNSAKHHGASPNITELEGYVRDAREFFEQACSQVFHLDFWSISLVELLSDGDTKNLLLEAERSFTQEAYSDCLIACRKAFFLEFEREYDIQELQQSYLSLVMCKAPAFAKEKSYVDDFVRNPFDYIVRDTTKIDVELARAGIDNVAFWNIYRLTPEVYRHRLDEWKVKHEPLKHELEGLRDRAGYVLENTVDIILKRENNSRAQKWIPSYTKYIAPLRAHPGSLDS